MKISSSVQSFLNNYFSKSPKFCPEFLGLQVYQNTNLKPLQPIKELWKNFSQSGKCAAHFYACNGEKSEKGSEPTSEELKAAEQALFGSTGNVDYEDKKPLTEEEISSDEVQWKIQREQEEIFRQALDEED